MSEAAIVNYHIKSNQPQAFQFDVGGVIGNLISPELVPTKVSVKDMRDNPDALSFETDGITFETHKTQVKDFQKSSDFQVSSGFQGSSNWQDKYDEELKALLTQKIGAKDVIIFDHTVRIDDPDAGRKPARNVHNDYSAKGAKQRVIDLVGPDKARELEAGHYGFVNVWRPVEHTIKTSPLGFIHPNTVKDQDWMNIELIYPDRTGQILGVAANQDHDWFYLSQMTPEEVAIFNIYDNKGRPFLAHSALDMEQGRTSQIPRKSIESRTLVQYK